MFNILKKWELHLSLDGGSSFHTCYIIKKLSLKISLLNQSFSLWVHKRFPLSFVSGPTDIGDHTIHTPRCGRCKADVVRHGYIWGLGLWPAVRCDCVRGHERGGSAQVVGGAVCMARWGMRPRVGRQEPSTMRCHSARRASWVAQQWTRGCDARLL